MESKTKQILEALRMQPLSEEEKAARHILGRLYGPIATTKEKTRNGRGYNKELWEKALADDIFKEKLATKSLFLELGHPADREETDMKMVCACIPEMPKIVDGDLYAYVDILDTENGRLLKTLCDYGFVPGISSRGSGDIMANDEVDPETFFLETWDIVQLPAVKKARLAVCEGFDVNNARLSKVLTESYSNSTEEEKKIMKETLDNLNIKVELNEGAEPIYKSIDEVPEGYLEEDLGDSVDSEGSTAGAEEIETEVKIEAPVEIAETAAAYTVGALIDELSDYDKETPLEWKPLMINNKECPITAIAMDPTEEGKVILSVIYTPAEGEDIELPADANPTVDIEVSSVDEPAPEAIVAAEEAGDAGDDEVIESLKDIVRQKDLLESKVKDLETKNTVSDAEVKKLQEDLNKYRNAFMRVSELAAKTGEFESANKALTEQLAQKDAEINDLQSKVESNSSLTESVNAEAAKAKALSEKLISVQNEADKTEKELNEQISDYRKKLQARTNLAKDYKAKYEKVLESYVASKADMLGVRPTDITSRLAEGYSTADVDKVCENLLTESISWSLPFGMQRGTAKMSINESGATEITSKPEEDDDLADLLELAGLK